MGSRRIGGHTVARADCADMIGLLTEYVEGGLPPARRAALEEHLADCAACTEYLRSLRMASSAVSRLRRDEIPRQLRDRLRSFLRLRLPVPPA